MSEYFIFDGENEKLKRVNISTMTTKFDNPVPYWAQFG